jgi:hypothetical protein
MRSLIERFIRQCLEPREEDTLTGRLRHSIALERSRRHRSPSFRFLRHFLATLGRGRSLAVIREIGLRRSAR